MKKQILEELNDIKYLFNYNRGKVISEQEKFESAGADLVDNLDMFMDDEDDEVVLEDGKAVMVYFDSIADTYHDYDDEEWEDEQ